MARRFRYRSFTLGFEGMHEAFEELMQEIHVDHPERFQVLSKSEGWDKEGMHHVSLSYVEDVVEDTSEPEKY